MQFATAKSVEKINRRGGNRPVGAGATTNTKGAAQCATPFDSLELFLAHRLRRLEETATQDAGDLVELVLADG